MTERHTWGFSLPAGTDVYAAVVRLDHLCRLAEAGGHRLDLSTLEVRHERGMVEVWVRSTPC